MEVLFDIKVSPAERRKKSSIVFIVFYFYTNRIMILILVYYFIINMKKDFVAGFLVSKVKTCVVKI